MVMWRMKVFINKDDYEWFKSMSEEGRTRALIVTSFPEREDDIKLELGE
jgi:hypothetical protein